MPLTFDYRVRAADKFFRAEHPDAHEVQEYGNGTLKRTTAVYQTFQTAQDVADALNDAAGKQIA